MSLNNEKEIGNIMNSDESKDIGIDEIEDDGVDVSDGECEDHNKLLCDDNAANVDDKLEDNDNAMDLIDEYTVIDEALPSDDEGSVDLEKPCNSMDSSKIETSVQPSIDINLTGEKTSDKKSTATKKCQDVKLFLGKLRVQKQFIKSFFEGHHVHLATNGVRQNKSSLSLLKNTYVVLRDGQRDLKSALRLSGKKLRGETLHISLARESQGKKEDEMKSLMKIEKEFCELCKRDIPKKDLDFHRITKFHQLNEELRKLGVDTAKELEDFFIEKIKAANRDDDPVILNKKSFTIIHVIGETPQDISFVFQCNLCDEKVADDNKSNFIDSFVKHAKTAKHKAKYIRAYDSRGKDECIKAVSKNDETTFSAEAEKYIKQKGTYFACSPEKIRIECDVVSITSAKKEQLLNKKTDSDNKKATEEGTKKQESTTTPVEEKSKVSGVQDLLDASPERFFGVSYILEERYIDNVNLFRCNLCELEIGSGRLNVRYHLLNVKHKLQFLKRHHPEQFKRVTAIQSSTDPAVLPLKTAKVAKLLPELFEEVKKEIENLPRGKVKVKIMNKTYVAPPVSKRPPTKGTNHKPQTVQHRWADKKDGKNEKKPDRSNTRNRAPALKSHRPSKNAERTSRSRSQRLRTPERRDRRFLHSKESTKRKRSTSHTNVYTRKRTSNQTVLPNNSSELSSDVRHIVQRLNQNFSNRHLEDHRKSIPKPAPTAVYQQNIPKNQTVSQTQNRMKKIFVGGFGNTISHSELKRLFADYGKVKDVSIVKDKGFGFVTFETVDEVERILRHRNSINLVWKNKLLDIGPAKRSNSSGTADGEKTNQFDTHHSSMLNQNTTKLNSQVESLMGDMPAQNWMVRNTSEPNTQMLLQQEMMMQSNFLRQQRMQQEANALLSQSTNIPIRGVNQLMQVKTGIKDLSSQGNMIDYEQKFIDSQSGLADVSRFNTMEKFQQQRSRSPLVFDVRADDMRMHNTNSRDDNMVYNRNEFHSSQQLQSWHDGLSRQNRDESEQFHDEIKMRFWDESGNNKERRQDMVNLSRKFDSARQQEELHFHKIDRQRKMLESMQHDERNNTRSFHSSGNLDDERNISKDRWQQYSDYDGEPKNSSMQSQYGVDVSGFYDDNIHVEDSHADTKGRLVGRFDTLFQQPAFKNDVFEQNRRNSVQMTEKMKDNRGSLNNTSTKSGMSSGNWENQRTLSGNQRSLNNTATKSGMSSGHWENQRTLSDNQRSLNNTVTKSGMSSGNWENERTLSDNRRSLNNTATKSGILSGNWENERALSGKQSVSATRSFADDKQAWQGSASSNWWNDRSSSSPKIASNYKSAKGGNHQQTGASPLPYPSTHSQVGVSSISASRSIRSQQHDQAINAMRSSKLLNQENNHGSVFNWNREFPDWNYGRESTSFQM